MMSAVPSRDVNVLAVISDKYHMLHFKPFGKTFNPEFIKSLFLPTVKITKLISQVMISILLFSLFISMRNRGYLLF